MQPCKAFLCKKESNEEKIILYEIIGYDMYLSPDLIGKFILIDANNFINTISGEKFEIIKELNYNCKFKSEL